MDEKGRISVRILPSGRQMSCMMLIFAMFSKNTIFLTRILPYKLYWKKKRNMWRSFRTNVLLFPSDPNWKLTHNWLVLTELVTNITDS